MFDVYVVTFWRNSLRYQFSTEDFFTAMQFTHTYDSWLVERCEIIEGLYYPIKVVARSADVV